MRPLKRNKKTQVTYDPDTGQDQIWDQEESQDTLSSEGSIDSEVLVRSKFRDCGCKGEIAGRCSDCGAVSCIACHGRCSNCKKPICLEDSRFSKNDKGEEIRLCRNCDYVRKVNKVKRFFFSAIIDYKDQSHG